MTIEIGGTASQVQTAQQDSNDDDAVNTEAFINKAFFLVSNSQHEVLNLQHKVCYARILYLKRKFLEAALRYYRISQIEKRQIEDEIQNNCARHIFKSYQPLENDNWDIPQILFHTLFTTRLLSPTCDGNLTVWHFDGRLWLDERRSFFSVILRSPRPTLAHSVFIFSPYRYTECNYYILKCGIRRNKVYKLGDETQTEVQRHQGVQHAVYGIREPACVLMSAKFMRTTIRILFQTLFTTGLLSPTCGGNLTVWHFDGGLWLDERRSFFSVMIRSPRPTLAHSVLISSPYQYTECNYYILKCGIRR
ncbi:hypothetical protein OROMI_011086 [Orobanche minor]